MKEIIKNIILNNMGTLKSPILHMMIWIITKWYMAVDLPYIIFPVLHINYTAHVSYVCYIIAAILGIFITMRILGILVGCLILEAKKYREN